MGLGGEEYRTAPTPSCYVSVTWGPLVVAVEMDPRAQIIAPGSAGRRTKVGEVDAQELLCSLMCTVATFLGAGGSGDHGDRMMAWRAIMVGGVGVDDLA